jgi:hypothetical protein
MDTQPRSEYVNTIARTGQEISGTKREIRALLLQALAQLDGDAGAVDDVYVLASCDPRDAFNWSAFQCESDPQSTDVASA